MPVRTAMPVRTMVREQTVSPFGLRLDYPPTSAGMPLVIRMSSA